MGKAYFDSYEVSHDSYVVLSGSSEPEITLLPRTIGGYVEESGIVEKRLQLKSTLIFPDGKKRKDIELLMHSFNELIAFREGSLVVNGNTYLNAIMSGNVQNKEFFDKFIRYDMDFILGNQDTGITIRQLVPSQLIGFSRGRKMRFTNELSDGSTRTFNFWHNFDLIKNYEIEVSLTNPDRMETSRVIRTGGFEKIECSGWLIGPQTNRQSIEAYFYNILNGPLGRVGTLYIDDQTINNCFLSNFSMDGTPNPNVRYELSFIASIQC